MEIKVFKKKRNLEKFIDNLVDHSFYVILHTEQYWFKTITHLLVFNEEDIKNYLIKEWHGLLEKLSVKEFEETIIINNNNIYININCEENNTVFCNHQEQLNIALQKILNIYLEVKFKKNYSIIINLNNYLKNQKSLFKKRIYQIIKKMDYSQELFHFEPMPTTHRKIIHEIVKKIDGIISYSLGAGKNRHVVIKLKKIAYSKIKG